MSDLSSIERLKFEALFDMESGYVLDFSNNTFSVFTIENVGIDIFDSKYEYGSGSKANRLRKFWLEESNEVVGKLLLALLNYWLMKKQTSEAEFSSKEKTLYDECQKIANRLNQDSFRQIQENISPPSQKGRIFISYRRIDSAGYAGRIYDRLVANFGVEAVFMDVDTIEGGTDFVKVLEDAVQSCDVLIALIGRQWLSVTDKDGKRRLDNPEDFVRIEIAVALKRNIRVIPVLVDGVDMPQSIELPENLKALARRNALQVNHHSFNPDVYRLIEHSVSALDEAEELRVRKAQALQATREKVAREKAERETAENAVREKAAREKAEKDAAEKLRLEAEELARQKAVKERAERESAEKARLEAEERARQKAAREKAEREVAEKIAREKAEKEAAQKAQLKTEEEEKQRIAKEKAERQAAEREKKEKERLEKMSREVDRKSKQENEKKEIESVSAKPKLDRPKAYLFGSFTVIALGMVLFSFLKKDPMKVVEPTSEINPTKVAVTLTYTETIEPTNTSFSEPSSTSIATSTLTSTPLPFKFIDSKGVPMVLVSAGEFIMGSEAGDDAKSVHTVYLDSYYMDIYEVTNAFYKDCVTIGVCSEPESGFYPYKDYSEHPVVNITWGQADQYCAWRGGSLPTEAQWEKAARGADERTYPWGEGIDCSKANYRTCNSNTVKIGSYESGKSPYGIYDMAGNVWEWTADWYDDNYYQYSISSNPLGPVSGRYRVMRGGSWSFRIEDLPTYNRRQGDPDSGRNTIGFRCVMDVP